MPRRSLSGFRQYAPFLDVQVKRGVSEAYSGGFTTNYPVLNDGPGSPGVMRLSYTPPVDAWWEVHGEIGIITCQTAAYVYAYGNLTLTPADADGASMNSMLVMQHAQVNMYENRKMHALFKLRAGVAYTADLGISPANGTWTYYCGPAQLSIEGKAWPR
jgi:hypothetical protein